MSFKFTGNWEKVIATLKSRDTFTATADEELMDMGWAIRDAVQQKILTRTTPKLADSTVARKKAQGAVRPKKIWVETGWILTQALEHPKIVEASISKRTVEVAATRAIHPSRGVPATTIMGWLENGTSNQPARPIFAPVLRDLNKGKLPVLTAFQEKFIQKILKKFE